MKIRRALLFPALALAFALGVGDHAVTAQTEMTTIRVASTPIDVGAEVYYAQALGLFKQAGLDVQIQSIDNGAAIAGAVAGGAADIGQSNVVSIATAYGKKLPFVVIAPAGVYSSASPTTQAHCHQRFSAQDRKRLRRQDDHHERHPQHRANRR